MLSLKEDDEVNLLKEMKRKVHMTLGSMFTFDKLKEGHEGSSAQVQAMRVTREMLSRNHFPMPAASSHGNGEDDHNFSWKSINMISI